MHDSKNDHAGEVKEEDREEEGDGDGDSGAWGSALV